MMRWLELFRSKASQGVLEAIFIAPAAGAPMISADAIQALRDKGLEGDRYAEKQGYWKVTEACQVTLISEHDLQRARRRGAPANLDQGSHRRNLVISGLNVGDLKGREFQIGEAVLRHQKPRPPCGYLDQLEGKGLAKALGRNSGICLQVIRSGWIHVGDKVLI